jgi:LysR family transcriptional activator of nhaA
VCREDNAEQLVAQLAMHTLDVVIADAPAPLHVRVKVFNHLLGESPMAFFAPPRLAARIKGRFPASLASAPVLLPTVNTALRRGLDEWFERMDIRPNVVGEFEDSALMSVFGQAASAVFPAPAVISREVSRLYGVRLAGRVDDVRERYYAISVERRLKHPGVLAITGAARALSTA